MDVIPADLSHWEVVANMTLNGVLPITKYKSKLTGLTAVFARAASPIVNGYFCLPTETYNNLGLPHTLEHLIFFGSEDYPYKEVLDLLANRCLSDRTNAWTAADHTCYTIYSAGSAGFTNILPIYLDHILYPLLRDEDFLTEIHHVSSEGKDSGVVYSEMQGIENDASNILNRAILTQLYPGNSTYGHQTGGRLKNLRENTTNAEVRAYHKKFYRSENLYLTITGNIEPKHVFQAIAKFEAKILSKPKNPEPYERPFQKSPEPLADDVAVKIKFPSDDQDFGYVSMGWRIPGKIWESMHKIHALEILADYMSSSTVSTFNQHFVELDEPLASSLEVRVVTNAEASIIVDLNDVPVEAIGKIDPDFRKLIEDILIEGPSHFDMEGMKNIIKKSLLTHKLNMENGPHLVVTDPTVLDMLYSQNPDHFNLFFQEEESFRSLNNLLNKTSQFWFDLLNETFSSPRVLVMACPSVKLHNDMIAEENNRLKKRKKDLGEEGLKKLGDQIAAALQSQRRPPVEVLRSIPVADVSTITFRNVTPYNQTSENQPVGFNLKDIPFPFHLDHMDSLFVRIHMMLDTSKLSVDDIPFMTLLTELWLESPLKDPKSGSIQNLEQLTTKRSRDLVSFEITQGFDGKKFYPGSYSNLIMFNLEATRDKYFDALTILKETIFNVHFTPERIKTVISKLLNGIPSEKLSATNVVKTLADNMYYNNRNNIHYASFMRQQRFLQSLLHSLKEDPNSLVKKLTHIREDLAAPDNCVIFVSVDLPALHQELAKNGSEVTDAWRDFFPQANKTTVFRRHTSKEIEIIPEYSVINHKPRVRHAIIGLPGSDSCYLKQTVPFDVLDYEDPELPAIRVMLQYMSDRMYDQIRGQGWVYGVALIAMVEEGRLSLTMLRASNLALAFNEFRGMIANYSATGNTSEHLNKLWDPVLLESARGSQIYRWAEKEETADDAATVSVKSFLRQTSDTLYTQRFVRQLANVTLEDVRHMAQKYLPIFTDTKRAQTSIVCSPNEVGTIRKRLEEFHLHLNKIDDLDNALLVN